MTDFVQVIVGKYISFLRNENSFELSSVRVIEGKNEVSLIKCMTEILGRLILVQVRVRLQLARVRVIVVLSEL